MSILVFLPGNILGKDLALRSRVSLGWVTALCLEVPSGSCMPSPMSAEGNLLPTTCLSIQSLSQQPFPTSPPHFPLGGAEAHSISSPASWFLTPGAWPRMLLTQEGNFKVDPEGRVKPL